MAVLAEGISVVVRVDAIARLMDDEWEDFVAIVPNQTLCCDKELARVGFMDPKGVEVFIETLEGRGFRYRGPGGAAWASGAVRMGGVGPDSDGRRG